MGFVERWVASARSFSTRKCVSTRLASEARPRRTRMPVQRSNGSNVAAWTTRVPPATADVVLDLHVDVVEYLGGTRYIYGTLSSGEALIVEARDMPRPKAGDPIKIGFNTARALLFSNGGQRLRPAR